MDLPSFVGSLSGYGLIGIVGIGVAEKIVPIVPSYVVLLFLGMTCASTRNDLFQVIAATTTGSTLGSLWWYSCGRALGVRRTDAMIARFGRYVFLKASLYSRLTNAYRQNHFWVTLVGQTIPVVRIYLSLPAGVLRLAPRSFIAATLLGACAFNALLLSLGYVLRDGGGDPLQSGMWAVAALVAAEFTVILAMRLASALGIRIRRQSQS
jgi:alkaline phosphatase